MKKWQVPRLSVNWANDTKSITCYVIRQKSLEVLRAWFRLLVRQIITILLVLISHCAIMPIPFIFQIYGYCPSWALAWEYRKKGILDEIRQYAADVICLQEVETDQFYHFFLPELKQDGYDGKVAELCGQACHRYRFP